MTGVVLTAVILVFGVMFRGHSCDDTERVEVSPVGTAGSGGAPETVSSQPWRATNMTAAPGEPREIANVGGVATPRPEAVVVDDDQRMAMLWAPDPVASLMPGLGGQTPEQQLESLKWMAKVPDKKASSFPDLRDAIDLSPQEREEIALRRIQELTTLLEADGYHVDEGTIPDHPIELRTDEEAGVRVPPPPDFLP
jgi:hypothetical protein